MSCRACDATTEFCTPCLSRSESMRNTDNDRITILEAAIRQHRLAVGEAYGIGSFKTQHAANMALWELVRVAPVERPSVFPDTVEETGLARPAMMEETE